MRGTARSQAREEIEVVLGLKQALVILVILLVMFGGTYLWGVETGHRRAQQGKASMLAFLEAKANPVAEPIEIPDVVLDPVAQGEPSPGLQTGDATQESEASGASAVDQEPEPPRKERDKPPPGVRLKVEAPARVVAERADPPQAAAPTPAAKPAPQRDDAVTARKRPEAQPQPSQQILYQVAAFKVQTNARGLVNWLRSEGLEANVGDEGEDGLYRVYVGPFRDATDAAQAKSKLANDGFEPVARRP